MPAGELAFMGEMAIQGMSATGEQSGKAQAEYILQEMKAADGKKARKFCIYYGLISHQSQTDGLVLYAERRGLEGFYTQTSGARGQAASAGAIKIAWTQLALHA